MSSDLPPEAFTKETLQKAFDWLQEQPSPVKASVHTPERLVSLYRKAQRLKDNDAPVSSKKFISDLKNLATSLDAFDDPNASLLSPQPQPQASQAAPISAPTPNPSQELESVVRYTSPGTTTRVKETKKLSLEQTTESEVVTSSLEELLDPTSMEKLETVKNRFNLSSNQETLRLLISLGFEKFSDFQ